MRKSKVLIGDLITLIHVCGFRKLYIVFIKKVVLSQSLIRETILNLKYGQPQGSFTNYVYKLESLRALPSKAPAISIYMKLLS